VGIRRQKGATSHEFNINKDRRPSERVTDGEARQPEMVFTDMRKAPEWNWDDFRMDVMQDDRRARQRSLVKNVTVRRREMFGGKAMTDYGR
jgi:hypothetical protein